MDKKRLEKKFHGGRRMFIIIERVLFIAPEKTILSHWEWVNLENITKNKNIFNESIRGFIDSEGIYFYKGENFSIDKKGELIFFEKLNKIVNKININHSIHVFGGMIPQKEIKKWPPKNDYGTIEQILRDINL